MIRFVFVLLLVIGMFVAFGLGVVAAFNTQSIATNSTMVEFFALSCLCGISAALLSEEPR